MNICTRQDYPNSLYGKHAKPEIPTTKHKNQQEEHITFRKHRIGTLRGRLPEFCLVCLFGVLFRLASFGVPVWFMCLPGLGLGFVELTGVGLGFTGLGFKGSGFGNQQVPYFCY